MEIKQGDKEVICHHKRRYSADKEKIYVLREESESVYSHGEWDKIANFLRLDFYLKDVILYFNQS